MPKEKVLDCQRKKHQTFRMYDTDKLFLKRLGHGKIQRGFDWLMKYAREKGVKPVRTKLGINPDDRHLYEDGEIKNTITHDARRKGGAIGEETYRQRRKS